MHVDIFYYVIITMVCDLIFSITISSYCVNARVHMDVFVCIRSFITDGGAVTSACHVTATQWAPFLGRVTLRAASVSADPA